ncbi:MAG: cupin domain-containing protein [Acidimicrobiales bacterium]
MSTEPSYLPLLRRIANAECNAERYLTAWADATPRADVRAVIAMVAMREAEHTMAFQKRICELGFDVTIEEAADTAERTAIAAADLTDREKFEKLGLGGRPDPSVPDRWASYFDDSTIDVRTGELLGRFIAEERDSVRMLADCCEALCAEEGSATTGGADTEDRLGRIERMLERLVTRLEGSGPSITEAEFREGLRRDGYDDEIRITDYDPNTPAGELHTHDFSARLYVLSGEFILQHDDGPRSLTTGQCCDVESGIRHAESSGPQGARVLAGLKHH